MKRILSVLLAAVMLCSMLVACDGDATETGAVTGNVVTGEAAADAPDLPDPATLNLGGEFHVLVSGNTTRNDYHSEGEEGSAVEIAIYRRNELIKEKYGVEIIDEDITGFGTVTGSGKGFTKIYTEYMSGESTYDAA